MTPQKAKELLPIIKAFSEGKTVQHFNDISKEWADKEFPSFSDKPSHYRIKPEPKYRPFKSVEECWNEMQKHQPFGWIKNKIEKDYYNIVNISQNSETSEVIINTFPYSFIALLTSFTFIDDSPFGIKEE